MTTYWPVLAGFFVSFLVWLILVAHQLQDRRRKVTLGVLLAGLGGTAGTAVFAKSNISEVAAVILLAAVPIISLLVFQLMRGP
jgi:hypothetical protein